MAVVPQLWLYCDAGIMCPGDNEAANNGERHETRTEVREWARIRGWRCGRGKDTCPDCLKAIAEQKRKRP